MSSPRTSSAHLPSMGKANSTHRKRLARSFAERTGRPYSQALEIVTRAAAAGRLPEPLDESGMKRALEILMGVEPDGAAADAADPGPCHAARTGEGYWTCDQHGCPDCRTLAEEIDDKAQIEAWDAERRQEKAERPEQRGLYLVPPALAALRLVWQGRVTKVPFKDSSRFAIDDRPATAGQDVDLFMLERDGYVEARLLEGEEWAIARTTDFGDEVLAANGADVDKFSDGLPKSDEPRRQTDEPDRNPYVGTGVDGARRSAEIDRSEADGLDRSDPRRDEILASAERWERQAARTEEEEPDDAFRVSGARTVMASLDRREDDVQTGLSPVQAALLAVEKESFTAQEGGRRKASDPREQRIWDLSWAYEHLTGSQGLVYVSSPGQGKDRFVFGGAHVALGREEALTHITGLVEALRLRDDITWPPQAGEALG